MAVNMGNITDRLRARAIHDCRSDDAFVLLCNDVHKAADIIEAQNKLILEMKEALEACRDRLVVMEHLTSCRSDDEWVWSAQEQVIEVLTRVTDLSTEPLLTKSP